nr:hypothetical protein [Pandoravirus massiliensis]
MPAHHGEKTERNHAISARRRMSFACPVKRKRIKRWCFFHFSCIVFFALLLIWYVSCPVGRTANDPPLVDRRGGLFWLGVGSVSSTSVVHPYVSEPRHQRASASTPAAPIDFFFECAHAWVPFCPSLCDRPSLRVLVLLFSFLFQNSLSKRLLPLGKKRSRSFDRAACWPRRQRRPPTLLCA